MDWKTRKISKKNNYNKKIYSALIAQQEKNGGKHEEENNVIEDKMWQTSGGHKSVSRFVSPWHPLRAARRGSLFYITYKKVGRRFGDDD